jgi:hypothetical protein
MNVLLVAVAKVPEKHLTIAADARRQYIPSQWSSFQVFRSIEYSSPIAQKIGMQ